MQEKSNRFVLRILLWHGLLLAGVLGVVSLASTEIYESARDDAIDQAKLQQELLAYQTCRGIETFYSSIISALGWIQDRQDVSGQTPGATPDSRLQTATQNLDRGPRPMAARLIAEQVGDRVSDLFVYNQRSGYAVGILPAGSKAPVLPPEMQDWLRSVQEVKISRFMKLEGEGVSLVAAPFTAEPSNLRRTTTRPVPGPTSPVPKVLVAAVPGTEIQQNFRLLDDEIGSVAGVRPTAALADSDLQVITASDPKLEGLNIGDFDNADAHDMAVSYHDHPKTMTRLFTEPLSLFGQTVGPMMVTLEPVHVGQDDWTLFYAYPLSSIDAGVRILFRRVVLWAGFVAAMVTGVLVSTAVQMIHSRVRLERVRHQVLTRELKQARRIQEQWLPDKSAIPEGLDVAAMNLPASHISGDFYNWFDLADGRQVFVIGDVTGHGMAAAFLMATTQLLVRNIMARVSDPGTAMEAVNRHLSSQMFHGQFVTMSILVMDFKRNQIEAASAGHPPPLIGSDSPSDPTRGKLRRLTLEAQLVLGVEKQVRYPTQRFALPPLSCLLLYTDGVLDARSATGDHFGTERLLAALNGRCSSAQAMIDSVSMSVRQFCGTLQPEDDLTMVAIRLRKSAALDSKAPELKAPRAAQAPAPTLEPLNPRHI
ncbi:MAG TPA: PP2C family protein-serine/threonine phosphatase [Tepidisphaeraceae bacterium]|nr:PP2C family protein-serine/threonine phosphatase [Tepidisphaeraceae bacterium]